MKAINLLFYKTKLIEIAKELYLEHSRELPKGFRDPLMKDPLNFNQLRFINHEAVVSEVESYIYFYNYKRLNSAIDYMTPNQKFNELKKIA